MKRATRFPSMITGLATVVPVAASTLRKSAASAATAIVAALCALAMVVAPAVAADSVPTVSGTLTLSEPDVRAHFISLSLTDDGKYIVAYDNYGGNGYGHTDNLHFVDSKTRTETSVSNCSGGIMSNDGKYLYCSKDGTLTSGSVARYDVAVGAGSEMTLPGVHGQVIALSPDDGTLYCTTDDANSHSLQFYDLATQKEKVPAVTFNQPILGIATSKDGKTLYVMTSQGSSSYRFLTVNAETGKIDSTRELGDGDHDYFMVSSAINDDGSVVLQQQDSLTNSNSALLRYNPATGATQYVVPEKSTGFGNIAAYSPDLSLAAVVQYDKISDSSPSVNDVPTVLKVVRLSDGSVVSQMTDPDALKKMGASMITVTSDGKHLFAASGRAGYGGSDSSDDSAGDSVDGTYTLTNFNLADGTSTTMDLPDRMPATAMTLSPDDTTLYMVTHGGKDTPFTLVTVDTHLGGFANLGATGKNVQRQLASWGPVKSGLVIGGAVAAMVVVVVAVVVVVMRRRRKNAAVAVAAAAQAIPTGPAGVPVAPAASSAPQPPAEQPSSPAAPASPGATASAPRFCTQCGSQTKPGARFCASCGARIGS